MILFLLCRFEPTILWPILILKRNLIWFQSWNFLNFTWCKLERFMLLSKLSVSIILSEMFFKRSFIIVEEFSEIYFWKIHYIIYFSNSRVKRQRTTLHWVIFSYCFGVNLIIGGVLLTLAILTLQRQPDGQVKFAMEIDKNWHFYPIFIYWFIWSTYISVEVFPWWGEGWACGPTSLLLFY